MEIISWLNRNYLSINPTQKNGLLNNTENSWDLKNIIHGALIKRRL